jgi:putative transposase
VAAILSFQSPRAEHEPQRQLLGQCGRRIVLRQSEEERIKKQIYKNREVAIADVAQYIDSFYNSTRRHSHLGGVSPEQFEAAHKPLRKGLH